MMDEITDRHTKRLEEYEECEKMMDQADLWMGKIPTKDGHGE